VLRDKKVVGVFVRFSCAASATDHESRVWMLATAVWRQRRRSRQVPPACIAWSRDDYVGTITHSVDITSMARLKVQQHGLIALETFCAAGLSSS
jgi:hypothetical protein